MAAGSTYTPIATNTLGVSTASVTFSSISGSYTDLVIVVNAKAATTAADVCFRVNGDSGNNYSRTYLAGTGTAALSGRQANWSFGRSSSESYMNTTELGVYILNFQNYSNSTTYKSVLCRGNRAGSGVDTTINLWRNTAAITSIEIAPEFSTNFASGSTFTLYGIAAA
jgi:hypothetical protein